MDQLEDKTTKKCILVICHFNKKGCTLQNIYSKLAKYFLSFPDISKLINELKEEDKISIDKIKGEEYYKLTKNGKKIIRYFSEKEFLELIELISPEYELKYRLKNIEFAFFCGLFSLSFYLLYHQSGFILFQVLAFLFFTGVIAFSIKIIFRIILDMINTILGTTYSILSNKSEIISWIIGIIIIGGGLFVWYIINPENFQQNLFVTLFAILLAGIVFLRKKIFYLLQKIAEKIKSHQLPQ